MSKRLRELIERNTKSGKKMLSLYVMAGFPDIDSTSDIILACEQAGVDFIELGMPFSDPIADGPVIQEAADRALRQGVNLHTIFEIVKKIRTQSQIPIILMGYLNPVFQFGLKNFFAECARNGVDGLILPDWPVEESEPYLSMLESFDLDLIYLIAPNTRMERIRYIDRLSRAFIYCTAYTGVTGRNNRPLPQMEKFLGDLKTSLHHPFFIGFGVKSAQDFNFYNRHSAGVIIGSAFIRLLESCGRRSLKKEISRFVTQIRGN
ncbi:tryptophan synthase subunit alpha [Calditrichota bacterium LG25]